MTGSDLDATDPRTLPGFFDALADGELLGGVCADCGQVLLPPRPACYACGSRAVDVESQSREGQISRTQRSTRRRRPSKRTRPTRSPSWNSRTVAACLGASPPTTPMSPSGTRSNSRCVTDGHRAGIALDYETDWLVHVFEPRCRQAT